MELCAGSLEDFVSGRYKGPEIGTKLEMIHQMVSAVQHLHSLNIIHGGLKPSNVLISKPCGTVKASMKLTDFGLRHAESDGRHKTPISEKEELRAACISTSGWVAPDRELTNFTDIYPLGCLICYIFTGAHPFGDDIDRVPRIIKKQPMVLSLEQLKDVNNGVQILDLIRAMVSSEVFERPTATQLLVTPCLQQPPNADSSASYHQGIFNSVRYI